MLIALLALVSAQAAEPSFDCDKAHSQIEHAICGDARLGALDREEARLYRLVLAAAPGSRAQNVARQRQFLRDRESCHDSAVDLATCLHDTYLSDITDLWLTWPVGREHAGLSAMPRRFHCDGGYPDVYLTLFELSPREAYVSVTRLNEAMILIGDGEHYVGREDRDVVFDLPTSRLRLDARICTPAQ